MQRWTENLFYTTLGMNPKSTVHSLIIFVTMFFIFVTTIWFIDELQIIPATEARESLARATGGLVTNDTNTASNAVAQTFVNSSRTGMPIVLNPVGAF